MVLLFVVGLILTPFAFFQIITKAGFSGWWTIVPYTPWIVGFVGQFAFRTVDTNRSIGTVFDQLTLWLVVTVLSLVFVMVMFFVFAFSRWPALEYGRAPRPPAGWGPSPGPRAWSGPPAAGPPGTASPFAPSASALAAPAPTAPSTNEPGWYTSGQIGAGEQSYWDGAAWTARRRWKSNAWIDLPLEPVVEAPRER
jgi:hypothetical protein